VKIRKRLQLINYEKLKEISEKGVDMEVERNNVVGIKGRGWVRGRNG